MLLCMLCDVAAPEGPGDSGSIAYYIVHIGVRRLRTRCDGALPHSQFADREITGSFSSSSSATMASTTMSRALAGAPFATSSAPRRAVRSAPAPSKTVAAGFYRPAFRQQRPHSAQRCGPRQACGPNGFAFDASPMGFRGTVNGRLMSAEEMMRVRTEPPHHGTIYQAMASPPLCCPRPAVRRLLTREQCGDVATARHFELLQCSRYVSTQALTPCSCGLPAQHCPDHSLLPPLCAGFAICKGACRTVSLSVPRPCSGCYELLK